MNLSKKMWCYSIPQALCNGIIVNITLPNSYNRMDGQLTAPQFNAQWMRGSLTRRKTDGFTSKIHFLI